MNLKTTLIIKYYLSTTKRIFSKTYIKFNNCSDILKFFFGQWSKFKYSFCFIIRLCVFGDYLKIRVLCHTRMIIKVIHWFHIVFIYKFQ